MFFPDISGIWSGYVPDIENLLVKNVQQYTFPPLQKGKEPLPYVCNGCGKSYKWRTSMVNHKRQECGKEPQYQCPYCPKRTKQKGNLMQHIKSRHKNENTSDVLPNY